MGIFAEALEKRKNQKSTDANRLPIGKPKRMVEERPESIYLKEVGNNGNLDPSLVVVSSPNSLAAENFRKLRTQLFFRKDCERPKAIMVTSAFPGEGKSYVAANLALSIAVSINEHALLVDCDLRKPSVHKLFGCPNTKGLNEHLTGRKKLEDIILDCEIKKLSLLTAGYETRNPSELLSSNLMKKSMEELKSRYADRFIIIDSTPCQIVSETRALADCVDGIIMVIMARGSNREIVQRSIEELGKEKILGIVFNGYEKSYTQYRQYYGKYYMKNYKNYCNL